MSSELEFVCQALNDENRSILFDTLQEECETNNRILKSLFYNNKNGFPIDMPNIDTIFEHFNPHSHNSKFELLKKACGMISETKQYIRYANCTHFAYFKDKNNNRIMSMCIYKQIGDAQYHVGITRSVQSIIMDAINNTRHSNLSIEMHRKAMKFNGVTRFFAPPLPVMLEILQKNFNCTVVKEQTLDNGIQELDYSNQGFSSGQLPEIKESWPSFLGFKTYEVRELPR